jgi:hypothetical protein
VHQVPPASRILLGTLLAVCTTFAVASVLVRADVLRSKADADQMLQKIAVIATNGFSERPAPRNTTVTEREVNSFLAIHARKDLPAGVLDPAIKISPAGRLTGTATVDLDAVRKARSDSGFSAVSLLTGRLPIQAAGVLRTSNGVGKFELQEAWVSSIPIPKAVLQEIVAHYSRTPDSPEGIDLDAPFELPAGIREIRTGQGQAIVVQ